MIVAIAWNLLDETRRLWRVLEVSFLEIRPQLMEWIRVELLAEKRGEVDEEKEEEE